MKLGVVMPVGPGRDENVTRVMQSLAAQSAPLTDVVLVLDGFTQGEAAQAQELLSAGSGWPFAIYLHVALRHEPGMEQPRNVGVRILHDKAPWCDHVWFVDSDVVLDADAHQAYLDGHARIDDNTCNGLGAEYKNRVLIGPYDWMEPGARDPQPELFNDPRWVSFHQYGPGEVLRGDLSAGLACFSGNLVWPIKRFVEVGGFWPEIHHGRCEDGELGLRAVACDVPISYVRDARGWHLWHPVNVAVARERNARDVPMINARHPWVETEGLEMVPEDGTRFNIRCGGCGASVNTLEWWHHAETCGRQQ